MQYGACSENSQESLTYWKKKGIKNDSNICRYRISDHIDHHHCKRMCKYSHKRKTQQSL